MVGRLSQGGCSCWERAIVDGVNNSDLDYLPPPASVSMETEASVKSLQSLFPVAFPIPVPTTHPELLTSGDIHREEDLLRNATSFRQWWTSINATRESHAALQRAAVSSYDPEVTALLGQLATPISRLAVQRLTYLFEAALQQFPHSFKMWKAYLTLRMSFVLGRPIKPKRAGGRKKFPEMREALEDEELEALSYDGGLDGVVGWAEWKALVAVFERALMHVPNVWSANLLFDSSPTDALVSLIDATNMVDVHLHLLTSPMSGTFTFHPCTTYF